MALVASLERRDVSSWQKKQDGQVGQRSGRIRSFGCPPLQTFCMNKQLNKQNFNSSRWGRSRENSVLRDSDLWQKTLLREKVRNSEVPPPMIYRAKGRYKYPSLPGQTPRILSLAALQQGALIKAKINSLSADECTSSVLKTKVYTLGKMQEQGERGHSVLRARITWNEKNRAILWGPCKILASSFTAFSIFLSLRQWVHLSMYSCT